MLEKQAAIAAAHDPVLKTDLDAFKRPRKGAGRPAAFGSTRARNFAFSVAFIAARSGGKRGDVTRAIEEVSASVGKPFLSVKTAYVKHRAAATAWARPLAEKIRSDEEFAQRMRALERNDDADRTTLIEWLGLPKAEQILELAPWPAIARAAKAFRTGTISETRDAENALLLIISTK